MKLAQNEECVPPRIVKSATLIPICDNCGLSRLRCLCLRSREHAMADYNNPVFDGPQPGDKVLHGLRLNTEADE